FCLGNVTKYTLRAPWKGGAEDCHKALEYLRYEQQEPQERLSGTCYEKVDARSIRLASWLEQQPGDELWSDIAKEQSFFLKMLPGYLWTWPPDKRVAYSRGMEMAVRELSRILALRDTTGQIYEGLTGLPQTQEAE
ncbi:MAG: DUF3310 domain-containing protein, partial [Desulfovibrio sp.]|nr:DUF3310 domain-containing protein [Desulfovibrio sp.]